MELWQDNAPLFPPHLDEGELTVRADKMRLTHANSPLNGYGGYKSNAGLLRGLVMGVAIIAGGWAFLTWLGR